MATLSHPSSPAHVGPVLAQAPTTAAAAPANKRKRTAGAAPSPARPTSKRPKMDKTFDTQLKRAEVWMGYTGKYDDWSDRREMSAGMDVSFKLGTMIRAIADAARQPDASWGTKKNAVNAVCHIVMAVLCAPVGRCAREVRHNIYDIENAFESAIMDALSAEERRRLAAEDEGAWMHFLADLEQEANSYCILGKVGEIRQKMWRDAPPSPEDNEDDKEDDNNDSNSNATETSHHSPEVRERPKAPLGRAPWYPVSLNPPIMAPEVPYEQPASAPGQTPGGPPPEQQPADEDFAAHLQTLRSDMGPASKYARCRAEKTLSKGADEIVSRAQVAATRMLRATARRGATWASKLDAFDTLLGMCRVLAGGGGRSLLWRDTEIASFVCGRCAMIDQVLMRLVQRMDTAERARLAGEDGLIDRLEDVMRETRPQRKMGELETVRDWLLGAL